jgi:hypothetical protein
MSNDEAADASVPDAIMPEQFFERLGLRVGDVPEKRLMFAVLLDAVIQLRKRNTSGAADAERWIRGEGEDGDQPFSFANVCGALGIDPSYLARGLLAWRVQPVGFPLGAPARQLRRSSRRITPTGRRRRQHRARPRPGASPPSDRCVATGRRAT